MLKRIMLVVCVVLGLGFTLFANPYEDIKYDKVVLTNVEVVDGDTIKGYDLDKKLVHVRFAYIDTMESSRNLRAKTIAAGCSLDIADLVKSGKKAKRYLTKRVADSKNTVVVFITDKPDKYGRLIGVVYGDNFNISLNEELVSTGNALPYTKYIKEKNTIDLFEDLFKDGTKSEFLLDYEECLKSFMDK